jgi:hypothetical protein
VLVCVRVRVRVHGVHNQHNRNEGNFSSL